MIRVLYYILILIAAIVISPFTNAKEIDRVKTEMLAMEGYNLSDEEAKKLEIQLVKNPNNLSQRIVLLGYYFDNQFKSDSFREAHLKHMIWIIKNRPESAIAGLPHTTIHPALDNEKYNVIKKLWLKQVKTYKQNIAIIRNASEFFSLYEKSISEDLLLKAQNIDPNNPEWSERLGYLYVLGMGNKSHEERKEAALKSFKQLENALRLTKEELKRFHILSEIAKVAYEAGELTKAKTYAHELLNKASQHKKLIEYGSAIHQGNIILGRVALKLGDLEKAKKLLIAAGETSGSPNLRYFGPNMALAKELLRKGEKEIVLEYLEQCSIFWESGKDQLKKWSTSIEKDVIPNFGANLYY